MNSLKDLKIGKWYQSENRIFMPIKRDNDTYIARNFGRDPDYMFNMIYIQTVNHMDTLSFEYEQWEVYIKEDRQYLFHVIGEDTIEVENIKKPTKKIFRDIFKGIFSYKWALHGGAEGTVEELKYIIKAIKET